MSGRLQPVKHTVHEHKRKAKYTEIQAKPSTVSEYERGSRKPETQRLNTVDSKDISNIPKEFAIKIKYADDDSISGKLSANNYKSALASGIKYATKQVRRVDLSLWEVE